MLLYDDVHFRWYFQHLGHPNGMTLWGYIELILKLLDAIFSTFGRKSKPEMDLPNTLSKFYLMIKKTIYNRMSYVIIYLW